LVEQEPPPASDASPASCAMALALDMELEELELGRRGMELFLDVPRLPVSAPVK